MPNTSRHLYHNKNTNSNLSNDVEEDNHDIEVAHMVSNHNQKLKEDHPLENIIGALNRPVSTRLQLHEQALFCYYDAFLTSVEPKNYKEALPKQCWIKLCKRTVMNLNVWWKKSKLDEDKEGKACRSITLSVVYWAPLLYLTASNLTYNLLYACVPAFADADHAGCQDTRRSTSGSVQLLGDRLVSWSSKRQKKRCDIRRKLNILPLSGCCAQFLLDEITTSDYGFGFNKMPMDLSLAEKELKFLSIQVGNGAKYTPDTLKQLADEVDEYVRIEKTKRSKNDQKPTRNGKKTKSQEQDKEISQKSQPDQPDTVKLSQRWK
ncbi:retrovirus-related pol polyprotein from transposon TNT 1-94 [Tanacetum coccineum]